MISRQVLIVLSFFIAAVGIAQSDGKDPKAKAILDKVSEQYKGYTSFKSAFQYELKSPVTQMDEVWKGKVYFKGEKMRLEYATGDLVINNGSKVWNFIKEDNEVNVYNAEEADEMMSMNSVIDKYKSGYKYVLMDSETIDSKLCNVIDLEPILTQEERLQNQVYKIRLYIEKSSNQIVKWKIFERNGNRYSISISGFRPNVTVADYTFKFDKTKYPGVVVTDLSD